MRRVFMLPLVALAGCTPSVGQGDRTEAKELVYNDDGVPVFAGQAIMIRSCGAGGFCHAETSEPRFRYGVPAELTFNLQPASTTVDPQLEAAERLTADQLRTLEQAGSIWGQVRDGRMPPGGTVGEEYFQSVANAVFYRVDTSGIPSIPMPNLESQDAAERDEAREILRNWLASGAPVVERTQDREDRGENLTGFTVNSCERNCVDIRWPAIYERVIVPSCAGSECHDDVDPEGGLDLFAAAPDAPNYAAAVAAVGMSLRGRAPEGDMCASDTHPTLSIMPTGNMGDAENSLFYLKIAATNMEEASCGGMMPLAGTRLSAQRLCAIRSWINCGACVEPDGGACRACFDAARMEAECNLTPDGSACATQTMCAATGPD